MRRTASVFRQPEFDPAAAYVARRAFRFGGADYAPGDAFDVRGGMRRARRMFEHGRLRMVGVVLRRRPSALAPKVEQAAAASASLTLVPRSAGWFDLVDADGNAVNERAVRKDAALSMAAGA